MAAKKKAAKRPPAEVEMVPVSRLKADPANARGHTARNMEAIYASLKRFGQQRPIVAKRDGVVLAGNGVLAGAIELGWPKVLVRWTDLRGRDATAYAIADNRCTDLSAFNLPTLKDELEELDASNFDMEAVGFNAEEMEALFTAAPPEEKAEEEAEKKPIKCPECGHKWTP